MREARLAVHQEHKMNDTCLFFFFRFALLYTRQNLTSMVSRREALNCQALRSLQFHRNVQYVSLITAFRACSQLSCLVVNRDLTLYMTTRLGTRDGCKAFRIS